MEDKVLRIRELEDIGIFDKKYQLIQSTALCLACGYSWLALRPTITFLLQCPSCYLLRAN